ncbi:MAG: sulfatase [candidate division KSB1 bacterium]|nr:sulfatase [candidate division KSB1 bacterium]
MNRRTFLKTAVMTTSVLGTTACTVVPKKKKNVLFIAIDDLNDWIGCMRGHPNALTPNIDRLAARGTVFSNAHCQAPICGPSRASMMTGLLPSTTGIYGQIDDNDIRESHATTRECIFLPDYFKQNGYKTMGIGKLFHHYAPDGLFDVSGGRARGFGPKPEKHMKWEGKSGINHGGTSTDWGPFPERDEEMPDYESAQWAKARLAAQHDQPFFLAVGFLRPHVPWHVPKKWFDLHPADQLELPPYLPTDMDDIPGIGKRIAALPMMPTTKWAIQNDEWKNIVQAYLACISFVDHYVGEILDALESSSYADNTTIVLWSDHGYHIGEKNRFGKHSLWEEATRAPLIISDPDFQTPQTCNKPAGMIDIYPTLLDLCGLPKYLQNQGHSLKPLLANPNAAWPHAVVTTYGRNNHSLRGEHFRYIRYEDGSEELYDHRSDENEWENLADKPGYETVKSIFRKKLPRVNETWSPKSRYDYNEYFIKQRRRES